MAIKFVIDVDGPIVLVDTVEDFEEAIQKLDYPIVVPAEVAEAYGLPREPDHDSAELVDEWQEEVASWTSYGSEAEH